METPKLALLKLAPCWISISAEADATLVDDRLHIGGEPLIESKELQLSGRHNIANALAAALAAQEMGCSLKAIRETLRTFTGLPHRHRVVHEGDNIRWIDDSKATNPHAARAAAEAYESVVLLAGGRNKDLDLSTIAPESVRHVVAFGEAAPSIAAGVGAPVTVVDDLASAVETAGRLAVTGDTVLLAPGCASFDEFDSYAVRGERFAELVAALEAAK